MAKFVAELTLPMETKGLLNPEYKGKSKVKIFTKGTTTTVRIEAEGLGPFKAALTSTLRDITIVAAASKAAKKSQRKT